VSNLYRKLLLVKSYWCTYYIWPSEFILVYILYLAIFVIVDRCGYMSGGGQQPQHRRRRDIRRADAHLGEALAASVGRRSVAQFWSELANFCGLNMAPQQWQAKVPAGHPFMRWNMAAQRWQVCCAQAGVQP